MDYIKTTNMDQNIEQKRKNKNKNKKNTIPDETLEKVAKVILYNGGEYYDEIKTNSKKYPLLTKYIGLIRNK